MTLGANVPILHIRASALWRAYADGSAQVNPATRPVSLGQESTDPLPRISGTLDADVLPTRAP
jgi:hypothetical protein